MEVIFQGFGFLFAVVIFYYYYHILSQIDAIARYFPGGYRKYFKIRTSTTTFDEIIGQDLIKEDLKNSSQIQGFIFSGPPGTGKTMLAKAIANHFSDRTFAEIYVNRIDSDIIISTIDYLISNYSKNGLIIYLDECYSVLSQFTDYFLRNLDGFERIENVLFICSTNHDLIDLSALTRKGRFKYYTFFLPNEQLRTKYFEKYRPHDLEHLSTLVANSEGLSYAELADLPVIPTIKPLLENKLGFVTEQHPLTTKDQRRVAVHELGHFLIACLCSNVEIPTICTLENHFQVLGANRIKTQKIYSTTDIDAIVAFLLGGTVAEFHFIGVKSTLCQEDLRQIKDFVKMIIDNRLITNFTFLDEEKYLNHLENEALNILQMIPAYDFECLLQEFLEKKLFTFSDLPPQIRKLKQQIYLTPFMIK